MADVFRYEVIPSSSWAYLSTILMVSIFFKFNRFVSVRNLDILMLSLLAPGLLIVQHSQKERQRIEPKVRAMAKDLDALRIKLASEQKEKSDAGGAITLDNEKNEKTEEQKGEEEENSITDPEYLRKDKAFKEKTDILNSIRGFEHAGYSWLFIASAALLIRMLVDPFMIRRPLLEPNLEFSGLIFLTIVLLFFLIANIVTASVEPEDITAAESGKNLATDKATNPNRSKGPGYSLLFLFPVIPTFVTEEVEPGGEEGEEAKGQATDYSLTLVARIMAIVGQLAIVIGIYLVGLFHFGNTRMGIGIVTLYLLLPYTAEMTGRIIHILPSAAIVWAVVCYRKPVWAGAFIGLAMGLAYYPIYLLPLWFSFYWHRGLKQFLVGFFVIVVILAVTLVFTSSDLEHFWENLRAMFGIWAPLMEGLTGFWEEGFLDASFRLPVIAAFFCLSISFAAWPAQKDLGTLLSCSAALMLAVQFWNGFGGGLLMAWYLPLALMTMFRPNLEDRTAIALALDK